jgi:anti-sigma-K factor RskA
MGMRERSHEELRSLLGAYALGSVPAEEEAAVRAHLRACDECRAEADSYAALVPGLALAVGEEPLPTGFADRVMSQIAVAPQPPAKRRWGFVPAFAVGAAVIAIVVLAALVVDLRSDLNLQREVARGLLSDEARTMSGAGAEAAVVPTDDGSVFVARGLEAAPEGRTYQLWFIDEGGPESGGTFQVEDGFATLESDRSLEGVVAVAVTLEPAGGSRRPTTTPLMSSS